MDRIAAKRLDLPDGTERQKRIHHHVGIHHHGASDIRDEGSVRPLLDVVECGRWVALQAINPITDPAS